MKKNEIIEYLEEFPSLKLTYTQAKTAETFSFIFGKKEEITKITNSIEKLVELMKKYDDKFSSSGWILYDSINTTFLEKVINTLDDKGHEEAEQEIINYYLDIEGNWLKKYSNSMKEFKDRSHLIDEALDNHYNGKYLSSIPLFLIIADGIVNDYTKSKGFFASNTDLSAWDCLVGANNNLNKIKDNYNIGRNKTNNDEILLPYRNGIIHGRDLNYGNSHNSCKCIVLLMAIGDWIKNKNSEVIRKEKLANLENPPSIKDSLKKHEHNLKVKNHISNWKSKTIIIGKDIPKYGENSDFKDFPYVKYLVETLEYWKNKNYGALSKNFINLFCERKSSGKLAKECRDLFCNKELIQFELKEVNDKSIALKVVTINVKVKYNNSIKDFDMKFGILYTNDKEVAIPELGNGSWIIYPQDIRGLYSTT